MERNEVDLNNCEREPIQFAGHVQDHGHLLAVDPERMVITHASAHAATLFGKADLLGYPLAELAGSFEVQGKDEHTADLVDVVRRCGERSTVEPMLVRVGGEAFDLLPHHNGHRVILEFEERRSEVSALNVQGLMGTTMLAMQRTSGIQALLQGVADQVKELIGYDRVMIYRFWEDWHGEVVAEARETILEPYLGLHYPASDIPRQARRLYETNPTRIITHVQGEVVPIRSRETEPLDLTHCQLRAVSPIHIEYLNNMGVMASFSISILNKGQLWGLIACHHYAGPRHIDHASRLGCNLIAQFLSATIELKVEEEDRQRERRFAEANAQLKEQLFGHLDVENGLLRGRADLLSITNATGAALCFAGQIYLLGLTPTEEQVSMLRAWLMRMAPDRVFQTTNLSSSFPEAMAFTGVASGMMSTTLSNQLGEYLLWFKPELVHTVDWAGRPEKVAEPQEDGGVRLSPRKSFEKWSIEVRATSAPWQPTEISAALALRDSVNSWVNHKANEIRRLNEKLRIAYSELDTFSFSISHDLKTPLNTVRGYLELVLEEDDQLNPETRGWVREAMLNTDRMLDMIRDILEYSKVGRAEVRMEPIILSELLPQVRDQVLAGRPDAKVDLDVAKGLRIQGQPAMIQQVLSNILDNAVKYSARSKDPKVRVAAEARGDEVCVEVADNGIGMDPGLVHKAFDLFMRLDNVAGYEGTGVGLSIVKRIVERHLGRIEVNTELGKGTSFRLFFPQNEQRA
ncbi:MAG: ATP-binding protein [Flavobacteriales bacterium]